VDDPLRQRASRWRAEPDTVEGMNLPAPEELLDRYGAVLADLAARHGLSNLRHGGPGIVVAEVAPGRTLNDMALFELEAESLLGHGVFVMSADAPAGRALAKSPLQPASAA